MERTQVYLSEAEREALDRRAEESGQTRSHLIREAIAAYLQEPTKSDLEQAIEASAGAWKRKGAADVDGATYVERLRTGQRWQQLYPEWETNVAGTSAKTTRRPRESAPSGKRSRAAAANLHLLESLRWLDVTTDIADVAGAFVRRYRKSHPTIDVVDYIIAGAARRTGALLMTLNVKHFPMFPGLEPAYSPGA